MTFSEEEMATAFTLDEFFRNCSSARGKSDGIITYDWDGDVVTIKVKCSPAKVDQARDEYAQACDDQDWCPTCCRVNI